MSNVIRGVRNALILEGAIALICLGAYKIASADVPPTPISATGIQVCAKHGMPQWALIILVYKDKVVRYYSDEMHGSTVEEVIEAAKQSPDQKVIVVGACGTEA
jgi:hypothetical protein